MFEDLSPPYVTIVADPPWPYKTPGGGPLQASPTHRPNSWDNPLTGSGSVKRYGSMTMDELAAMSVEKMAADNAHLYLWTTNGFIEQAHGLARDWGFAVKTVLTWTKVKPDGTVSMKTGYYFRGATEHVLFCVRGSLKLQTTEAFPTGFLWPRTPHSVKPESFFDLVEKVSPGPYLEIFARRRRLGWDAWGDGV